MADLEDLFDNPTYSDLTIRFGANKFRQVKVHKAVVCLRLEYFENLCGKSSKEPEKDTIKLVDDDPDALRVMLHYLYTQDFDACLERYSDDIHLVAAAKVYVVASKYGCEDLQEAVEYHLDHAYTTYAKLRDDAKCADPLAAMAVAYDSKIDDKVDVTQLRKCLHKLCRKYYYTFEYDLNSENLKNQPDRRPFLKFLSSHPRAALVFAKDLVEYKDLEAIQLLVCPGCGEEACKRRTPGCGQPLQTTTHFRIKPTKIYADRRPDDALVIEGGEILDEYGEPIE